MSHKEQSEGTDQKIGKILLDRANSDKSMASLKSPDRAARTFQRQAKRILLHTL